MNYHIVKNLEFYSTGIDYTTPGERFRRLEVLLILSFLHHYDSLLSKDRTNKMEEAYCLAMTKEK